jgi:hypothetical protein
MQVSIESIPHPIYRDRTNDHCKWVIVNKGDASPIIKILVATVYRGFNGNMEEAQIIRGGQRNLYEADVVITTNILCKEFSVIKNRYNCNPLTNMTSDYFLNSHINYMIMAMGFINPYEIELIKHGIVGVLSMITGEQIRFINGKYKTMRDLYYEKNLIKYQQLKHNFLNARIS